MYSVLPNGVQKKIETWQIILPLHNNDGQPFEKSVIDSILDEIILTFPGMTLINCTGYWRDEDNLYVDDNLQVLIDVLPSSFDEAASFFLGLKEQLQHRLQQEKIYVTKEASKEEFISFDEFLEEAGIEPVSQSDIVAKKRITEQLLSRYDFVMQRLGYETITLRRDKNAKKIIWVRRLCGIVLESVIEDPYPEEVQIVAADQFDRLARVFASNPYAIIGNYEFQSALLHKSKGIAFRHPERGHFVQDHKPQHRLCVLGGLTSGP